MAIVARASRGRPRVEWGRVRDSIDLSEIINRQLGPPPGRNGNRSDRMWWRCPFHDDRNPSLCVRQGERRWRCFGCGAKGDAVDFARRLHPAMSFPDILAFLAGTSSSCPTLATIAPLARPKSEAEARPEDWQEAVREAVTEGERRLWSPNGAAALDYLRKRGLKDESIRSARLGWFGGDRAGIHRGIAIPWMRGEKILMVNVRRPEGCRPKYMAIPGSRREGLYLGDRPDPGGTAGRDRRGGDGLPLARPGAFGHGRRGHAGERRNAARSFDPRGVAHRLSLAHRNRRGPGRRRIGERVARLGPSGPPALAL